mmetsp:Transcript_16988/g.40534  ORF Transcript_16988/g.40534 Transcript_16988/m.40534 type:complete len:242 (+) Transcript_16988:472-1197(+)
MEAYHGMLAAAMALLTACAMKEMRPSCSSMPDMPTRTANQVRVSQAPRSCRQSCQLRTPVPTRAQRPSIPATGAETPIWGPKIHSTTREAITPRTIFSASVTGPISSSFLAAACGASGVSFTPGGKSLKSTSGVMARLTRPGTHDAMNHEPHEDMGTPMEPASLLQRRFCAAPVMKRAEVMPPVCRTVVTRYAPMRRSVPLAGSEPQARERLEMIGSMTPPWRAVVDGIPGQMIASVAARA